MAVLDAFADKCVHRREVLCQPHGCSNARKRGCVRAAEEGEGALGVWVEAHRAADRGKGKGQIDEPAEVLPVDGEARKRAIDTVASGPCMRSSLYRAGVVCRGERQGRNAVHHSLVMRHGATRVGIRRLGRCDYAPGYLGAGDACSRELGHRDGEPRLCPPAAGGVGEHRHECFRSAQPRGIFFDLLREGIEEIRPHRVPDVCIDLDLYQPI